MDDLYSDDIREREQAAKKYRVFPQQRVKLPSKYRHHWKELLGKRRISDGDVWPADIAKLARMSRWPEHAFGTANSACLFLWHRPGEAKRGGYNQDDIYIGPKIPVLGGIPHAHNKFWTRYNTSPSWRNLHKYLPQAFDRLEDPWSQVMIACLNPEHGDTGDIDSDANMMAVQKGGRIDKIVAVCKPKVILACGKSKPGKIGVDKAMSAWGNPLNIRIIYASHPSALGKYHWSYEGPRTVEQLSVALYEN